MDADAEDDWLEPDDQMGIWEYQLHPLTVRWLREALTSLVDDVPVQVELYDGTEARTLRPMDIDLKGRASNRRRHHRRVTSSWFLSALAVRMPPAAGHVVEQPSRAWWMLRPCSSPHRK